MVTLFVACIANFKQAISKSKDFASENNMLTSSLKGRKGSKKDIVAHDMVHRCLISCGKESTYIFVIHATKQLSIRPKNWYGIRH